MLKYYRGYSGYRPMADTTTIEVSMENWRWLNQQKDPGDSFNDVLDRLRPDELGDETPALGLPDELDLPGSGTTLEAREMAIARLYMHLEEEETASKADLLELIDPENVGYSSAESFWSNAVKGRDSLRALPGVEAPNEGEHTWRFVE
jgi:hypothetical protein